MKKALRVGLIGTGYIADFHAVGLAEQADVELAAIANRGAEKGRRFAARHGVPKTYATAAELIADRSIEAVILSVPNVYHREYAINALKAGKHVFVEKPMACSTGEALEMAEAAERAGVRLMVGHMWRFDREARYLHKRVAEGELGRVFRTTAYGIHAHWGPGGWFVDPALACGGALADMGVHAIDTTRYLLGDPEPSQVYAKVQSNLGKTTLDDTAVVMVEWSSGVSSIVESGWWQPHMDGPEASAKLYGTEGFAVLFPTSIKKRTDRGEVVTSPEFPPRMGHCDQHMYTEQMAEFVQAVREEREPVPGAREGIVNMRILDAAYESSRTRRVVYID